MSQTIRLQPKQCQALDLVEGLQSSWVGIGGGRGGAKSGCQDRIMIVRRQSLPGTIGTIVMRNSDQVRTYHEEVIMRDFPDLEQFYRKGDRKIVFPQTRSEGGSLLPPSEIHFSYAETLKDVIRRFRSASNYDLFCDQAEQFTEAELREMKQSVRWKGVPQGACKFFLAFNFGGAGIDFLRNKFHLKKMNVQESPDDFAFVHVFPWDNVEWVRPALEADGLTEENYYFDFSEDQRKSYCASRSDYGRNLVSQDAALVKRDWDASWDSLEGAFFGRVWDRDSVVLEPVQVENLIKPWSPRWLSQDWGKGHYCPTYWFAKVTVSPKQARELLGWTVSKPFEAIITYREYIAGGLSDKDEGGQRELAESDIAKKICALTPLEERAMIAEFFLSPDAFEMSVRRYGQNEIANIIAGVMTANSMVGPNKADNERRGGWSLMYNMLLETMRHAINGADVWLISADCPELINAIPLLQRNPEDLDDVLKTDAATVKIEQDCGDAARYGLKSKLLPGQKPKSAVIAEALAQIVDPTQRHIQHLQLERITPSGNRAPARFNPLARLEGN